MKLTILNCVVKVDESNARRWTCSRSSRFYMQNVQEVKTLTAAEMVENEPFMYNKMAAGLDAKGHNLDRSLL